MSHEAFSRNCLSRGHEPSPSAIPTPHPESLYTLRTHYSKPVFSAQPPSPHALASKNAQKQKLTLYTLATPRALLEQTVPRRPIFLFTLLERGLTIVPMFLSCAYP
jgi:hypothetical protein